MNRLSYHVEIFLAERGLRPDVAIRHGVISVRRDGSEGKLVPDPKDGKIVQLTYLDETGTKALGAKYRATDEKRIWQAAGKKPVFWNLPDLQAAADGNHPLIITEGEFDALAAVEAGYYAVSVPNGAPPKDFQDDTKKLQGTRWSYLWEARELLKKIPEFVICADNDEPGRILADGLISRLGAARCWRVEYPAGCKDLNDVLKAKGVQGLKQVIERRTPYPISGVFTFDQLPDRPTIEKVYDLSWAESWKHLKCFPGQFMPVTGIPGEGKSTFALNVRKDLYEKHGVRSAIFSPEMEANPMLVNKLTRLYAADDLPSDLKLAIDADRWLERNHEARARARARVADGHVLIDRPEGSETEMSLEWIMETATEAVLRHDIGAILIDPWNEVEHAQLQGENLTAYINRAVRKLKAWAKAYGMIVIVVAHPTKAVMDAMNGKERRPVLYDIEGSAAWKNKADTGLVIYRPRDDRGKPMKGYIDVIVEKSRYEEFAGETGEFRLAFHAASGRFSDI